MDMAGNAFEWVNDLYNIEYYHAAPDVNPPGPTEAHTEVSDGPTEIPYFTIRGGSYRARWYYPRVTHRHWGHKGPNGTSTDDLPRFRNNYVGFRCARSLP
jgi:formylglycine-generating enzyme required for sulfatase activity